MKNQLVARTFLLALAMACSFGCGNVGATSPQQQPVPPQAVQQAQAGQLMQVFTLTTSNEAIYSDPSGALVPMPSTFLNVNVQSAGLLTISFSARGTVQPSGSQLIPIVFIECRIDSQACQPDSNTVEFLYPQFCCDTRSFEWVAQNVSPGSHTVEILWGMGNPTSAVVTNRSLIVEAAAF